MSAWIVSKHHIDQLVYGAVRVGVLPPDADLGTLNEIGAMLTRANIKSIRARYGRWDESAQRKADQGPYRYRQPGTPLSDAALCKQVHCYDYQTCEYDGYDNSRARSFVNNMERMLEKRGINRDSPGYDQAPWGV